MSFIACRICHGTSKRKCMFCGQSIGRVKDMTVMEKIKLDSRNERIAWLRTLYNQLKAHKMTTTGDPHLDEEIKKEIGRWYL